MEYFSIVRMYLLELKWEKKNLVQQGCKLRLVQPRLGFATRVRRNDPTLPGTVYGWPAPCLLRTRLAHPKQMFADSRGPLSRICYFVSDGRRLEFHAEVPDCSAEGGARLQSWVLDNDSRDMELHLICLGGWDYHHDTGTSKHPSLL